MQTTAIATPNDSSCEPESPMHQQQDVENLDTLVEELKRLLVRHHTVLTEEGMRKQMEALEHWVESQRAGPAPAGIVSESGISWLKNLHDRLKLSAEEIQRLEGEGGNPASTEQAEKVEELLKAVRRIEHIIDISSTAKH